MLGRLGGARKGLGARDLDRGGAISPCSTRRLRQGHADHVRREAVRRRRHSGDGPRAEVPREEGVAQALEEPTAGHHRRYGVHRGPPRGPVANRLLLRRPLAPLHRLAGGGVRGCRVADAGLRRRHSPQQHLEAGAEEGWHHCGGPPLVRPVPPLRGLRPRGRRAAGEGGGGADPSRGRGLARDSKRQESDLRRPCHRVRGLRRRAPLAGGRGLGDPTDLARAPHAPPAEARCGGGGEAAPPQARTSRRHVAQLQVRRGVRREGRPLEPDLENLAIFCERASPHRRVRVSGRQNRRNRHLHRGGRNLPSAATPYSQRLSVDMEAGRTGHGAEERGWRRRRRRLGRAHR
mmetsp:Transcript_76334/g.221621  ORF Transcript_76334/g.221621 Transcript_76334/m.221621 type:complete len:348 (+) Transcript_76334:2022-3065(+)